MPSPAPQKTQILRCEEESMGENVDDEEVAVVLFCWVNRLSRDPHLADIIPGRTNRGVAVGHLRSHIAVIGAHDQFIRPERLFMAMKRGRF